MVATLISLLNNDRYITSEVKKWSPKPTISTKNHDLFILIFNKPLLRLISMQKPLVLHGN